MTKQQIFNKVVRGLAKQGFRQSRARGGKCMYRGPRGLKCAAGFLIADKHFRRSFNSEASDMAVVIDALQKSGIKRGQIDFVRNLQSAHDLNHTPDDMKIGLADVAREHRLTLPAVLK